MKILAIIKKDNMTDSGQRKKNLGHKILVPRLDWDSISLSQKKNENLGLYKREKMRNYGKRKKSWPT